MPIQMLLLAVHNSHTFLLNEGATPVLCRSKNEDGDFYLHFSVSCAFQRFYSLTQMTKDSPPEVSACGVEIPSCIL